MNIPDSIFIDKQTTSRLIKDIKNVYEQNLEANGIYYKHDEENLLKGYALIIGPEKTPYENGYYFFEINFPNNYPYSPPIVKYDTNQDKVRFNPNLYINNKVCVSILNTWHDGDPWSPCQTISTVLLSIFTLFNNEPLLNEPGVTYDIQKINKRAIYINKKGEVEDDMISIVDYYNLLIEYSNINIAICNIILKNPGIYKPYFNLFYPIIIEHFIKNKDKLISFCKEKMVDFPLKQSMLMRRYYFFEILINYPDLIHKLEECYIFASNFISEDVKETSTSNS